MLECSGYSADNCVALGRLFNFVNFLVFICKMETGILTSQGRAELFIIAKQVTPKLKQMFKSEGLGKCLSRQQKTMQSLK